MFTKDQLTTLLENKGAVSIVYPIPTWESRGLTLHRVSYRVPIGTEVLSEPSDFVIAEVVEGVPAEGETPAVEAQFKYHKEKPEFLKDDPAPPRDFHKTEEWLKTKFDQAFTDWEAKAVTQRRDGDADIITVEAVNPAPDNKIVYRKFKLRMNGTTPEFNEIA